MARVSGALVVKCSKEGCDGKMVMLPGDSKVCKKCGTKTKLTKKLMAEMAAAKKAAKPAKAAKAVKAVKA